MHTSFVPFVPVLLAVQDESTRFEIRARLNEERLVWGKDFIVVENLADLKQMLKDGANQLLVLCQYPKETATAEAWAEFALGENPAITLAVLSENHPSVATASRHIQVCTNGSKYDELLSEVRLHRNTFKKPFH